MFNHSYPRSENRTLHVEKTADKKISTTTLPEVYIKDRRYILQVERHSEKDSLLLNKQHEVAGKIMTIITQLIYR